MVKIGGAISGGFKAVGESVVKPTVDQATAGVGDALKTFGIEGDFFSNSPTQNQQNQQNQPPSSNVSQSSIHRTPKEIEDLKTVNLRIAAMQKQASFLEQNNQIEEQKKRQLEAEEAKRKEPPQFVPLEQSVAKASPGQRPMGKNPEKGKMKS